MPKKSRPRRGSMAYWPRKRAKDIVARVHYWALPKDAKPAGFAGYKAGMTHISYKAESGVAKGLQVSEPVTIIECPPIRVAGVVLYKKDEYGVKKTGCILAKLEKNVSRVFPLPKKEHTLDKINPEGLHDIRLLVNTHPEQTGVGKKKPDVFEIAIGGNINTRLEYAKSVLGKDINIEDAFANGAFVDVHSVTKGKGLCGPVKRFGVMIRSHKAEKTKRGPGTLGPWHGPRQYRVPKAGQMGFNTRMELNKQIVMIGNDPKEIIIKGGIPHYGLVKSKFVLIAGSVGGPKRRLIKMTTPLRPHNAVPTPKISYISTESKQ